jgi:hypothetical protein
VAVSRESLNRRPGLGAAKIEGRIMKPNPMIMRATTLFPSKLAAIAVVPVLALTIALIGGAFTDKASAQTPNTKKPFAVGAFTTMFEHVAFAAQQNPKTDDPLAATGHVVQQLANGTNSGPVTCFQPSGNAAYITFLVKNNGPDAGDYVTFYVMDGGYPMLGVSPDTYIDYGNQGSNNCFNTCGNYCPPQMILSGNIVVSN